MYKWKNANKMSLIKYSIDKNVGQVDGLTTLQPEDDAATNFYQSPRYRMPTKEEFDELIEKCEWKWTKRDGVDGYEVSRNGKSIFLPATTVIGGNPGLAYWSSTLNTKKCTEAYLLVRSYSGGKANPDIESAQRAYGNIIRAVRK